MIHKKKKTLLFKLKPYLLIGFVCGLYPFLFYFSNNYSAINTWNHFGFFLLIFVGLPILGFLGMGSVLENALNLRRYRNSVIFVSIIMAVSTLMSYAMYLTLKKKVLLGVFILAILLSKFLGNKYDKVLTLIGLMAIMPFIKNLVHLYEHTIPASWDTVDDSITDVSFKKKPNIYIIQPDGYTGQAVMEREPYHYKNPYYEELEQNGFKTYPHFRSNYPASLTSNASLFAMKQHKFGGMLFPSIEMPHARKYISGKSTALEILKRNGYHTSFIVQDEYFQQNRPTPYYDYYNINFSEIPYFSNDSNVLKSVADDLKAAIDTVKTTKPRFYFVEKLLPHHIHFAASKEEEREHYLRKIEEVNLWLRDVLDYIEKKDPKAIVILLADHGGWVGINSYSEMFSTTDASQIKSIYSGLAAIKWNGHLIEDWDAELKSSVNVFRILFSVLSEDEKYLKHLEDNSSYNLRLGSFRKSIHPVIDDTGKVIVK